MPDDHATSQTVPPKSSAAKEKQRLIFEFDPATGELANRWEGPQGDWPMEALITRLDMVRHVLITTLVGEARREAMKHMGVVGLDGLPVRH